MNFTNKRNREEPKDWAGEWSSRCRLFDNMLAFLERKFKPEQIVEISPPEIFPGNKTPLHYWGSNRCMRIHFNNFNKWFADIAAKGFRVSIPFIGQSRTFESFLMYLSTNINNRALGKLNTIPTFDIAGQDTGNQIRDTIFHLLKGVNKLMTSRY